MERLTSRNKERSREMICRYEECCTYEECCPLLSENDCRCLQEVAKKLAEYEDLEEQGLLLKLPCKLGDVVYDVVFCDDKRWHIFEMQVCSINPFGDVRKGKAWNVYLECVGDCSKSYRSFYDFGKTVFLTQAEAEEALKKVEEGK